MARIVQIVGQHFRKPAPVVLYALAEGTPLTIRPEPNNPADSNAKAIWLKTSDIPSASWEELKTRSGLSKMGFTIGDLHDRIEWQMGYIPAIIASEPEWARHRSEIPATLTFVANKPCIRFTMPGREGPEQ